MNLLIQGSKIKQKQANTKSCSIKGGTIVKAIMIIVKKLYNIKSIQYNFLKQ